MGIFVHESYAKCKARLVGLIDNDNDVFYLILLYYHHFTQKPDGLVRRALGNEIYCSTRMFKSRRKHLFLNLIIVSNYFLGMTYR